jgi:uncharacterized protein (DUF1697 family)
VRARESDARGERPYRVRGTVRVVDRSTQSEVGTLYAVFLRGINLGTARRIAMADLRAAVIDAGYEDVRTLLASGNLVLRSTRSPENLADHLERVIEERFGLRIPVAVRTEQELAEVVALNPLKQVVTDPARYVVTFFDRPVPADALAVLDGVDLRGDRFQTHGRELYAWTPDGISRSQASDALAKHGSRTAAARAARVSGRNWNTVTKVLAALRAANETR